MASVSLITYCKGRHLDAEKYFPAAIAAMGPCDELVFVDYSDPGDVKSLLLESRDGRITLVSAPGREWFHANHSRNLGLRAAAGDLVVFTDVDFCVTREFVEEVRLLPARSYYVQPDEVGSWGCVACFRADALEIQGWDEAFVGYGCDDLHFRRSLDALGRTCFRMKARLVGEKFPQGQVRIHEASQNVTAAFNRRLAIILRGLHPYKENVSRNWCLGGQGLRWSELGYGLVQSERDRAVQRAQD